MSMNTASQDTFESEFTEELEEIMPSSEHQYSEQIEPKSIQPSAQIGPVSSDNFNQYFAYPYLSEDEEKKLAQDFSENGCLKAAHALVMSHMRYVVKIARGYLGYGLPLSEMVQEGALGLMKAVKKFNPLQGARLVSFAVYWIKAEIHEYIIKNWRLVKIATTKSQRKLFFNYRRLKENQKEQTLTDFHEQVAGTLNVSVDEVNSMSTRFLEREVHLDQPLSYDSTMTLSEIVPSAEQSLEDLMVATDNQDHYQRKLPAAFDYLNTREQDIIRSRFFDEGRITLKELADKYNISVERVRQLEKNALTRMKSVLQGADCLNV